MSRREFHFSDGKSNKFWTVELSGKAHTVRFGRIGTAGQAQTKVFASEDEARKSHDKLIAEKVKKGYVEQAASGSSAPAVPATKKADKKEKEKPQKPAEPEPAAAADKAAPAAASSAFQTAVTRSIDLALTNLLNYYWESGSPPRRRTISICVLLARTWSVAFVGTSCLT